MADDKGTSQLFGESLPGTGGDYIDTNDVEGHMGNKHITPMPPSADGPEGNRGPGGHIPTLDGGDTEGHRKGPGGNIPNADGGDSAPTATGVPAATSRPLTGPTPRVTARDPAATSRTSTAARTASATSGCTRASRATTTSRATASQSAPRARTRTATASHRGVVPHPQGPPTAGLRAGRSRYPPAASRALSAVAARIALVSNGVTPGWAARIRVAYPAMCGAAKLCRSRPSACRPARRRPR